MQDRETILRTSRIIHLAITVGALFFLVVAAVLVHREDGALGAGETAPLISYVSLAAALGALAGSVVAPRVIRAQARDPLVAFQAAAVVRAAILEGPALLGCVAYLLEGRKTPLGAGVALGMILILAGWMPTGSRLDAWLSARSASPDEG